jgi:quinoprotein glucose dehydrogenase
MKMPLLFAMLLAQSSSGEWPCFGGDPGGQRYSSLSQITPENVAQLGLAWTFQTGEKANEPGEGPSANFEATPIMVDGTLFLSTPRSRVFALDAESGKEKWRFDPKVNDKFPAAGEPLVSRGVATWAGAGGRRIYVATYDARLIALDAATGKPDAGFGKAGTVDLKPALGKIEPSEYTITSPPTVAGDLVIVGSCIGDNHAVDSPSGMVRAFDARTGALRWTWDPLGRGAAAVDPRKPTLPGSANAWSIMSVDAERDMLFVPTGSQSPDFYGGKRPGDNRDADSVVALQASTGKRLWGFQVVHHDLWDYDVPAQPILATVKDKPAVIVLTKMGHVFVLDRLTGAPIFPVEERAVPGSDVAGETASLTQPFPVLPLPLAPARLGPEDVWGVSETEKTFVLGKLKGRRNEGIFTPPSLAGTVLYPGNIGGSNWSGGSFDPGRQVLYSNLNRLATVATLIPRDKVEAERAANPGVDISEQGGTPYAVRRDWFFGHNRVPGTKPPWGVLDAVDLVTGELKWEKPVGRVMALRALPEADSFGSPNLGGSFTTATGLVFIAAGQDSRLRAYDAGSGAVLWQMSLPAGGNAGPMTYLSPSGRQMVVICAGGHSGLGTKFGDYVLAYALPK